MGIRFEKFKARVNGEPLPPEETEEECPVGSVCEDMHGIFHDLMELAQEDMTNERWDQVIQASLACSELIPEDFTHGEVATVIFFMLKDFRDFVMTPESEDEK